MIVKNHCAVLLLSICLAFHVTLSADEKSTGVSCVDELHAESALSELLLCVSILRDAIVTIGDSVDSVEIPPDSVLIVDSPDGCPAGWRSYERAHGRFIVGVGVPSGKEDGEKEVSARSYLEKGGQQEVTLSNNELPAHSHRISTSSSVNPVWHAGLAGSQGNTVNSGIDYLFDPEPLAGGYGPISTVLESTGNTEPYSNLPPFIGLYLCKRN